VKLFEHLLRNNAMPHIQQFVKKGAKEQSLPPNLPKEEVESLPYVPGVYYFHDQKGKVVYVGKAKNLRYRVRSHFTHNGAGKQRQNFLRTIHKVTYQTCATELMAFLLESVEIKRLWPPYNNSQKKFTATYGVYSYLDRNGYMRLMIDKKKKNLPVHFTFQILGEGHQVLRKLVKQHQLCPRLCYIQTDEASCQGLVDQSCKGACEKEEAPASYNSRVEQAIHSLKHLLPSFAVIDEGEEPGEQSCVLIERGNFYGMGKIPAGLSLNDINALKSHLQPYPENDYAKGLVYSYVEQHPEKRVDLPMGQ
jgi:DNA polymerase-3 subunit epsilon